MMMRERILKPNEYYLPANSVVSISYFAFDRRMHTWDITIIVSFSLFLIIILAKRCSLLDIGLPRFSSTTGHLLPVSDGFSRSSPGPRITLWWVYHHSVFQYPTPVASREMPDPIGHASFLKIVEIQKAFEFLWLTN